VQTFYRNEFGTQPATLITIVRLRYVYEVDVAVQNVNICAP